MTDFPAVLRFVADRLVLVYGESDQTDYILTLRKLADEYERGTNMQAARANAHLAMLHAIRKMADVIDIEEDAWSFIDYVSNDMLTSAEYEKLRWDGIPDVEPAVGDLDE